MSECVVRMEMPKACWFCGLRFVCKAANDFLTRKEAGCSTLKVGMEGCLILCQLPEGHGRLVDAEALLRDIEQYHVSDGQFQHWLELQSTIVPAERSEEK